MMKRNRRISLTIKLNILIAAIVLFVSLGLTVNSYFVYRRKIDGIYYEKAEKFALLAKNGVKSWIVGNLKDIVLSEEFQAVRAQALAANNDQMILDYLEEVPSLYTSTYDEADQTFTSLSMAEEYDTLVDTLERLRRVFGTKSVYIQFDRDGTTYNIVNSQGDLFYVGSEEDPNSVFGPYEDNERIPATVYHEGEDWLCSALEQIGDAGEIDGIIGVDIDMNDIMEERHWFLVNSIILTLVLTALGILAGMLVMRQTATQPLRLLARAATSFAMGDAGYTREDIIDLPIYSNDEIGDLYKEIRSMQSRIVDYTDNLTRVTAEKERTATELRTAARIQEAMLPDTQEAFPDIREFALFASMKPAKEVGGDFYDFVMVDEDHLAVCIADVSDKGVPAALFMMAAKIILNYRVHMGGLPGEILTEVNELICRDSRSDMFVTVWLGILDLKSGVLTCSNAGHEYPVVRGTDGIFEVYHDKHDMVIGAIETAKYHNYEILLKPGDAVFVYTDGLPEASNPENEMYGMKRLQEALNHMKGETPEGILNGIMEDVKVFVGDADQFDDLTMLCLEYSGDGSH